MADTVAETLTGRAPTSPADFFVRDSDAPSMNVVARIENVATEAYCRAIYARVEVDNTVTNVVGVTSSISIEDGASISSVYGFWVYQNALTAGASVDCVYGMSIIMNNSEAVNSHIGCFRLYCAGGTCNSVFHLANSGGTPFTYLFDFEGNVAPANACGATGGNTRAGRIACLLGTTACWLSLYTD